MKQKKVLDFSKYKVPSFPNRRIDPSGEEIAKYEAEWKDWIRASAILDKLKEDCLDNLGILNHPKAEAAWELAWEFGFINGGYEGVYDALQGIVELLFD
jgi:hypothetical protein